MSREMTQNEAEEFVLGLLRKKGVMTTSEIEAAAMDGSVQCPDAVVRFLNRMKMKGLIGGKLSMEHRGWVWYLKESGDADREKEEQGI